MNSTPVTTEMGEKVKTEMGLAAFVEVSAKTQKNLYHAFNEAIRVVLYPDAKEKKQKKPTCMIL
jgi:hypothetical protein